ncbi:MAG TPA: hypothetical protein VGF20_00550 [Candidatus Acidoferrum sp.]
MREPVQRLADAHAHRILACAQQNSNFPVAAAFEKAEQKRLPISLAQFEQSLVEFGREGLEQRIVVLHKRAKFERDLFTPLPAQFAAPMVADFEQCRLVQPAGQAGFPAQPRRFACQGNKHILRNLLRRALVTDAAKRRREHQIQMPLHQRCKSTLRPILGVFTEQLPVCL